MNKLKNLLICRDFEDWKTPFYQLLEGKSNLIEFEKEVYKLSNLEDILEKDLYIDLLSYNYEDKSQFTEILQLVKRIINIDDFYRWKLCNLLKESGLDFKNPNLESITNYELPNLLLEIYGEMEIGEVGQGEEQAKSNITFLKSPLKSDLEDYWVTIIGEVVQVGLAHHGNIIIFMNNEGIMYIYIELTNKMYIGGDFEKTMSKLLFGLDYGKLISLPAIDNL
ncbi:hypothetical protein [Aquimarina algiphila]|uniref:Uncharacterized protein n=1 Tax=Aquimarina algiphila TaxID=2047982 RepID=A0A554VAJ0_9FLAO|nr:hypothetical protein [Aquimarina algiphila]TSE03177.1 hypothetical protein FOF46_29855 [Aquimarina algiphila]